MNTKQVICLENVSLRRDNDWLLKDLNWTVEAGQHWALLGPNGAGKTLMLRLVTGYLWPTDGSVSVLGHTLGTIDLRKLRQKIGWVAQSLSDLIPGHISLLDTIISGSLASLGLYEAPTQYQIERARQIATNFSLANKLDKPFAVLSSGERQRALLARAIMADPELLILDEPMSNLDMGGRELFLNLVCHLAESSHAPTIILTTHNTLEIGSFINRSLLIKNGRLTAQGPLETTLNEKYLAQTFDLPLKVEKTAQGRYLAYL